MKVTTFSAILCVLLHCVTGKNILIFHTAATSSHRTSLWPLVEKMGDVGHNITYVYPATRRIGSHPQVKELIPIKVVTAVDHFVGDFDINFRLNNSVNDWLQDVFLKTAEFCEAFYDSPETIEWLATPNLHYDLVMMDGALGQCAYRLVHKFRAKHILFNPATMSFLLDPFGIVQESASVPEMMFHRKPEELQNSLWSRVVNTLAVAIWRYAFLGTLRSMESIAKEKLNLTDMPSFEEIEQETSLVLHNSYFIEDYPMSLPPMFVSYSGMLCTEKDRKLRKPLPKELEEFVGDKESDGFVYISFGSSILISAMPEERRDVFLGALGNFPRLKFLFKWTGEIPQNAPGNILFQSWFPQKDVLAHPRIKAFIFQAGRPSTQEALCYGVPMIAIPIFGDQDLDADRLVQIGAAVSVDISQMTTETLTDAIKQVAETDKYKTRVTELMEMFRDRPMDPVEYVYYWVEYVLKYDTELLKPLARNQPWWQRRLLDVYAVILGIVVAVLVGAVIVLTSIFKFVRTIMRRSSGGVRNDPKKKI